MIKNIIILFTVLVIGAACGDQTKPDFMVLETVIQYPGIEIIGYGRNNTAFVRIPETPEISAMRGQAADSVFWSDLIDDDITQYATDGFCLVNASLDSKNKCPYRIYCGTQNALKYLIHNEINYAITICA